MAGNLPRVGFLTGDIGQRHGWARYSLDLLQALQRAGLPMTVVSARNSPDDTPLEQQRLLPNTSPAQGQLLLRNLLAAPSVARALHSCDLIHTLVEPYAVCGSQVAGRRPYLVTAHGSYVALLSRRPWPARLVWRRALERAQLVCVSNYTAQVARQLLPGAQPLVIANGIDPQRFALPAAAQATQGPTVLSVGALKPRKGTLELIRTMAQVIEELPQAQCVIIGSQRDAPAYAEQVRRTIHEHGLTGQVHLLGQVDEETLLGWYAAAQVFALPSLNVGPRFEGFGLAHLEASAAGLPVISTRDCGVEDAIVDGVTGLLVAQEGVTEALAAAILTLLRNPQQAQCMGAAGRGRAQEQTWERVAQELLPLYAQLAAQVTR